MRLIVIIASLVCTIGIFENAHAQFAYQIGGSDPGGSTGVGTATLFQFTTANESSGNIGGGNTAVGETTLYSNTTGSENNATRTQRKFADPACRLG